MSELKEPGWLRELQDTVAAEKGLSPETLRRLLAKVEEYSESHHALGLHDDLLAILLEELKNGGRDGRAKGTPLPFGRGEGGAPTDCGVEQVGDTTANPTPEAAEKAAA